MKKKLTPEFKPTPFKAPLVLIKMINGESFIVYLVDYLRGVAIGADVKQNQQSTIEIDLNEAESITVIHDYNDGTKEFIETPF